nr:hypothetical protein [uncultured Cupriavidus sp.]
MQKTKLALSIASTAALLALAACGGGGGDSSTQAQQPSTPTTPAPTITVQGTAAAVAVDPLALVFVPHNETSTRPTSFSVATNNLPATLQKVTATGAYTTFAADSVSSVSLSTGVVADVTGDGNFAIGRWTNGTSSLGAVSVNQGDHYVAGKPLSLTRTPGPTAKLNCSFAASTSPTAISGNFAPGKVNSATAVIDLNGPLLESFNISVAVGSDTAATASVTGTTISGIAIVNGVLAHIQVMGSDAAHPVLAVGYAMPTPSSGDVTGVVALRCQ